MVDKLTEDERKYLSSLILRGEKIPSKYAPTVLRDAREMELTWSGKSFSTESAVLPFQSIEHIEEPRESFSDSVLDWLTPGDAQSGWTNKLIWGDNKLILSSLLRGPLKQQIDTAGGLKLVYIDPPFDVGYDFSVDVTVGDVSVTKAPSVLEQVAYRDTWGKDSESFASMMYERLQLIHGLLASDGSLFVHCDFRTNHIMRSILDEIFGQENFRNEIVWWYRNSGMKATSSKFHQKHDTLFFYSKSDKYTFNGYREPLREGDKGKRRAYKFDSVSKKPKPVYDEDGKPVYFQVEDILAGSVWDVPILQGGRESVGYPTQKPEALLERVIESASNEGDLVADFFCGSGTTLAVAEKLGRNWIGTDLGRFAIHTSKKRLIEIQRSQKENGQPFRPFEVLNLGNYERELRVAEPQDPGEAEDLYAQAEQRRFRFLKLVLEAYEASPTDQLDGFHGTKGNSAIYVGSLDSPVTQSEIEACIEAALNLGVGRVDILGFEFEMGVTPMLSDSAKELGLTLTLKYIPNEIFEPRAVQKNQVSFFEVGYLELEAEVKDGAIRVSLKDFGVFYRQTDADEVSANLRAGSSKVVVDGGHVVRVWKKKSGEITREVLTSKWSDWIDYWAVDFNYEARPELVAFGEGEKTELKKTGRFIFENMWQSFRSQSQAELELTSDWHQCSSPGVYRVGVKVIDLFGNDTTRVISVQVG